MAAVCKKGSDEFDLEGLEMLRLDRLNSASSSSTTASISDAIEVPTRSIDWSDFNYPPLLNIIHFDMQDLPQGEIHSAGRLLHLSLKLTFALLALNIADTVAVVALYEAAEKVRLLYAVLNAVIFGALGFYGFYKGMKGLAEGATADLDAFRFAQTLLTVFTSCDCVLLFVQIVMVCFATVPCGSIEGFLSDAMLRRETYADLCSNGITIGWLVRHGFWFVSAMIESVGWSINVILSFYVTSKVGPCRRQLQRLFL
ncbi:hypothetical protein FOZ61_004502 [Perkinsus olseni]|uniref:Uncharacterized protein n=1 Tax=Perkinsus olseni TaxID=32597 RepID=A0A7J6LKH0_PEROL|nr:hypothetical protein FOZ61_004502 [Perkinsus olseni]